MKYDIRYRHEVILRWNLGGHRRSEELRPAQTDWPSFQRALAGGFGALSKHILLDTDHRLAGAIVRVVRHGRDVKAVYEQELDLKADRG